MSDPNTFEALTERIPHEKDLSGVQGFPGQVMFINSRDYPCKQDCVRCQLAALAPHYVSKSKVREIVTKLREQAGEMASPYWTKEPEEPTWDYVAKAFGEIADEVTAMLGEERDENGKCLE